MKDEGTSSTTTLQIIGKCVSLTLMADKRGQLENIMSHRQRRFLSHGGLKDKGPSREAPSTPRVIGKCFLSLDWNQRGQLENLLSCRQTQLLAQKGLEDKGTSESHQKSVRYVIFPSWRTAKQRDL